MADTVDVDLGAALREIVSRSHALGLDPYAVLGIAKYESAGFSGAAGDNDSSFGPFQLHIGGRYPASAPHESVHAANEWAWSKAGIDYALDGIAAEARGLRGPAAVQAISTKFEQPADPQAEIRAGIQNYNQLITLNPRVVTPGGQLAPGAVSQIATAGTGSASAHAGSGDLGTALGGFKGAAGAAGGAYAQGAGDVAGAATGAIRSVGDLIGFVTSWRFAEILGGVLLLIVGLILVGRSLGLSTPRTPFDRYAARQPTSRQGTPRRTTSYTLEADRPAPARPVEDFGEVPF